MTVPIQMDLPVADSGVQTNLKATMGQKGLNKHCLISYMLSNLKNG